MRTFFKRRFRFNNRTTFGLTFFALLTIASACDDVISGPGDDSGRVARAIKFNASAFSLSRGGTRQLEAIILDQNQQPFTDSVPDGTRIEWKSSDTTIVTVSETGLVTAKGTGEARVDATLASAIGRPTVGATIVVAAGAHHIEGVSGYEQEDTVKETLKRPIIVRAVDENQQPIAGALVNFTVDEEGGTADPASALTDEEGLARTTWTFGTKSGVWQVKASLADNPDAYTYISATANPGKALSLRYVSGADQTGTVGEALAQPLVVQLFDAYENPVPNKRITWRPFETNYGSFDPEETRTDENGMASTIWTLGDVVGHMRAVARCDSLTAVGFNATGQAAEPTTYNLVIVSGNGQYAPQLHKLPEPLKIRLIDGRGRPVAGRLIRWDTPSHDGSIEMNGEATDENGELTAEWTLGEGEAVQTVTVRTTGVPGDPSATFTAHAGKSPRMFRVSAGEDQPVIYGEPTPQPIVVRVLSFDTMPVRGVRVSWSVGTGDRGTIQVLNQYTNERGEAAVIYTPRGNNFVVPSFTDPIYGHRNITVGVLVYRPVDIEDGDGQLGPINQKLQHPLQVRILDDQAQPIVGRRVTWTVTSGGGTVSALNGDITDAEGLVSAEWTLGPTIGLQTVVAKADGITKYQAQFQAEGTDPNNPLRRTLVLRPVRPKITTKAGKTGRASTQKKPSIQKTPTRNVSAPRSATNKK